MKTATIAAVTALAALIVAAPGVSTVDAQAGVKIKANNKIKPRIRVKPKIRVRVNTKRLLRKKQTETQTARRPAVPNTARQPVRPLIASDSPGFAHDPALDAAIAELGRNLADIDIGDADVSEIARIDVAAVDLAFPVHGLDDDAPDADTPSVGLRRPGGEQAGWDPNDVLPGNGNRPETGHLTVHDFSARDAADSTTAQGKPDQYTGEIDKSWRDDEGNLVEYQRSSTSSGNYTETTTRWFSSDASDQSRSTTFKLVDAGVVTYSSYEQTDRNGRTTYGRYCTGANCTEERHPSEGVAERTNPDAPGGEVIPVNCGSVHCNEARKGKGLVLTGQPGARVLTADPSDPQNSTVGNAPRTDSYWREAATTNPGTEPTDTGDGGPVKTSNDQILVLDEADGTIPSPGGR